VPLNIAIRENGDAGTPIVAAKPDSDEAKIYKDLAKTVMDKVTTLNKRKITIPVMAG
jgi:ATP-binding protein involved in chromosome partitioning